MSQAPLPPIIGLDIGRSAVKVAYEHNGQRASFLFPSNVCLAHTISHEETADAAEKETVTVAGQRYFTGLTARQQGRSGTLVGMSDGWIERPEYLALVAAALKKIEAQGVANLKNAYLIIGSPSSVYDEQRVRLADITRKVIDTHIKVMPQPSGAYFAHIFSPKGIPLAGKAYDSDEKLLDWAVIEIGHYTTDFIMIQEGRVIANSFDSTEGIGNCIGMLGHLLAEHKIKTSEVSITEALVTGKIKHFGKEIDVSEMVEQAVAPIVQKVIAKADAIFDRDAAALDGIILAGGGAQFMHRALHDKWPHVCKMENSRMAVAEGFLRYGLSTVHRVVSTKPSMKAA